MIPVWSRVSINRFVEGQCDNSEGVVMCRKETAGCVENATGEPTRVVTVSYLVEFGGKGCCNSCDIKERWFCEADLTVILNPVP